MKHIKYFIVGLLLFLVIGGVTSVMVCGIAYVVIHHLKVVGCTILGLIVGVPLCIMMYENGRDFCNKGSERKPMPDIYED